MAGTPRTVFEQPDAAAVHARARQVINTLEAKFPKAAAHLDEARADLPACTAFPREIWWRIWSDDPRERLNKEIRGRTDVVGIFPDRRSLTGDRLIHHHRGRDRAPPHASCMEHLPNNVSAVGESPRQSTVRTIRHRSGQWRRTGIRSRSTVGGFKGERRSPRQRFR